MRGIRGTGRPVWFNVLLGEGFGAAGQLLINAGLVSGAGWFTRCSAIRSVQTRTCHRMSPT
jgi:hypothetical protein